MTVTITTHLKEYHTPMCLDHALKLLVERGERAAVVGGGSIGGLRLPTRVQCLVDLSRCGLEELRIEAQGVHIGATVCAATLAASAQLDELATGVLREAAAAISPQAVRNQATVAGNLMGYLAWSDLPVALTALDAHVHTACADDPGRTLSIGELYQKHPRKVLRSAEIIAAVEVPRPKEGTAGAFVKVARTTTDVSLASAAACLRLEPAGDQGNLICRGVRVVLGAVQQGPRRLDVAEKMAEGQPPSEDLFRKAAEAASTDLRIRGDARTSKEYRRRLAAAVVRRALCTAWQRAAGMAPLLSPRRAAPPPWTRADPGADTGRILLVTVDGTPCRIPTAPHEVLLDVLRREGFVSVKRGCDEGYCGTCSVLVDGRLLNACLLLAAHVQGCSITTAAGIGSVHAPHPLQEAFVEEGAVQCGFCTPGMIVASKALLDACDDPTDEEARIALDGNLCRCTGYVKPLLAIHNAAAVLRKRQGT